MERIAAAYDVTDARVAVLPDMVLAAGGRGTPAALDLDAPRTLSANRLDRRPRSPPSQRDAERGGGRPRGRAAPARRDRGDAATASAPLGVIGGHMVLTIGLALILQPTPEALGMAAGASGR